MVSIRLPVLNKKQTEQLIKDLNSKTSDKELAFWKQAIINARKIKEY